MLNINTMKYYSNLFLLVMFFPITLQAQSDYQPLHGLSDYNYLIMGELELEFSNSVNFPDNTFRQEGHYIIKTPMVVMYNLNDLKFFKAQPQSFLGIVYDETLVSTPLYPLVYLPENTFMNVESHVKSWEYDQLTEVKAKGKIEPLLQIEFNHEAFISGLSTGQELFFRVKVFGTSDSYTQQSDVSGYVKFGNLTLTEGLEIPVSIGCGTFFPSDLGEALMTNQRNLTNEKSKTKFETDFSNNYYRDLPKIAAIPLIDFLIDPKETYLVPLNGSFSSSSSFGKETAQYKGTLRLFGGTQKKF